MSISEPFIRRPIATSLLMLGVLVFGICASGLLPQAALPLVRINVVHAEAMPIDKADEYAFTVLAQKLSTVKGVSQVQIYGQKPYAAHIQVNPGALAARGIGLEDVRGALVAATVNRPKGNLEGLNQAITLDTNDQLFNASSFGNVIVTYRNGAPVRIKNIGDAVDGVQNARTGAWFEGKPTELLAIQRDAGANTLDRKSV